MINLLPPELKQEIGYSKRNATILHYVWLTLITLGVTALIFIGALFYLNREDKRLAGDISQKQSKIDSLAEVEKEAKTLNERLTSIKKLQTNQARFSILLNDLAKVTPKGVYITGLALTGEDKKPIRITAVADSYNSAAALRSALVTSTRVAEADIDSITSASEGGFTTSISLGFKPGQSR